VQLSVLQGIECRLIVRDGVRPELVLEPDLGEAHAFFQEMWGRLALGLAEVDEIGDFSASAFALTLFSSARAPGLPLLTYADGLTALRESLVTGVGSDATPPPGPAHEALARVLGAMGAAAGQRLGLPSTLALAFGDGVAYCMTGVSAGWGTDFERGVAHQLFRAELAGEAGSEGAPVTLSPYEDRVWITAQPGLARVFEQHKKWQSEPRLYETARDRWHVALTFEMKVAAVTTTGTEIWRFGTP
jgi:hypothetical protein